MTARAGARWARFSIEVQGRAPRKAAFTVAELVIGIGIIVLLIGFTIPAVQQMRTRAQRIQCMANLRSLSVAAELYLQQNGSWPQIPLNSESDTVAEDHAHAWIAALKPFGVTEKTWICPTIQNLLGNPDYFQAENVRVDYAAMPFDDKPITPHQWPRQPWFIETGDIHGNGNLIIFTDGSISDLKTIAPSAK